MSNSPPKSESASESETEPDIEAAADVPYPVSPDTGGRLSRFTDVFLEHKMIILAGVILCLVGAGTAYLSLNWARQSAQASRVGTSSTLSRDPNQQISPAYQVTIDTRDNTRLGEAKDDGRGFVPEFTVPAPVPGSQFGSQSRSQPGSQPGSHIDTKPGWTPPEGDRGKQGEQASGAQEIAELGDFSNPAGVQGSTESTESTDQRSTASSEPGTQPLYTEFLGALIDKWSRKPSFVTTTYNNQRSSSEAASEPGEPDKQGRIALRETLIDAGAELYAYTRYGLNSDIRSPVVLEILGGRFRGGVITGSFEVYREEVLIRLTRLDVGGESHAIDAYAVDLNCGCFAHEGDVDHHYIERVLVPAAAQFAQGFLLAATRPSVTLDLNSATVTSRDQNTDTEDHLLEGLGSAGQRATEIFSETAPTGPTVRIARNTEMLAVFVQPVMAAGTGTQSQATQSQTPQTTTTGNGG